MLSFSWTYCSMTSADEHNGFCQPASRTQPTTRCVVDQIRKVSWRTFLVCVILIYTLRNTRKRRKKWNCSDQLPAKEHTAIQHWPISYASLNTYFPYRMIHEDNSFWCYIQARYQRFKWQYGIWPQSQASSTILEVDWILDLVEIVVCLVHQCLASNIGYPV